LLAASGLVITIGLGVGFAVLSQVNWADVDHPIRR
jgi:hypothetical protein